MTDSRTETAFSSVSEVLDCMDSGRPGRYSIRPRVILSLAEEALGIPQIFSLPLPSSGIGSITTLEATMLVAVEKLLRPGKIFEFGTFLGYTTRCLSLNAPEHCEVLTLDLPLAESVSENRDPIDDAILTDFHVNDTYLTSVQAVGGPAYFGPAQSNIRQLRGDSREFDVEAEGLTSSVDLVFVDGAHDYATAKIDSRNAFEMVGQNGVIFWHDVGSSLHTEVDSVVEEIANDEAVFLIAHTMLAFVVRGESVGKIFGPR